MAVVWKKLAFSDDAPNTHESTHVSGGSDDIDSALADAAIPSLATSKITSGQFPLVRIPRGTDTHVLTAKGAGVSPAYEAPAAGGVAITLGSYAGDNSVDRAIPHGLGITPKVIFITSGAFMFAEMYYLSKIYMLVAAFHVITIPNATNFYVGNAASYFQSANATGTTYYWVAIG